MNIHNITIIKIIMINFIKKTIKKISDYYKRKKIEKIYKKRVEELRKRDPFIYKH
jgi:hypothetical protein